MGGEANVTEESNETRDILDGSVREFIAAAAAKTYLAGDWRVVVASPKPELCRADTGLAAGGG